MCQPIDDLKRLCHDELKLRIEYEQFENNKYNSSEGEFNTYVFEHGIQYFPFFILWDTKTHSLILQLFRVSCY